MLVAWALAIAVPNLVVWTVPWDKVPDLSAACITEVHPFAFGLSNDGRPVPFSKVLVQESAARSRAGALLFPVIVNDITENGRTVEFKSPHVLEHLLGTPARRSEHVAELVALAQGASGLEIDYERIPPALWSAFAGFVGELAGQLHAQGKKLQVDLEGGLLDRANPPDARLLRDIATHADRVNWMMYYERGAFRGAPAGVGPGSSLPWIRRVGRTAAGLMPKERVGWIFSLAATDFTLPVSGTAQPQDIARLPRRRIDELIRSFMPPIERDVALGSPWFRYTERGIPHQVFFEDEQSLRLRIAAAQDAGIRHVGLWYLGTTPPDVALLCSRADAPPRPPVK